MDERNQGGPRSRVRRRRPAGAAPTAQKGVSPPDAKAACGSPAPRPGLRATGLWSHIQAHLEPEERLESDQEWASPEDNCFQQDSQPRWCSCERTARQMSNTIRGLPRRNRQDGSCTSERSTQRPCSPCRMFLATPRPCSRTAHSDRLGHYRRAFRRTCRCRHIPCCSPCKGSLLASTLVRIARQYRLRWRTDRASRSRMRSGTQRTCHCHRTFFRRLNMLHLDL